MITKIKILCKITGKEKTSSFFGLFNSYRVFLKSVDSKLKFKQDSIPIKVPDWQYYDLKKGEEIMASFYEENGLLYPVPV